MKLTLKEAALLFVLGLVALGGGTLYLQKRSIERELASAIIDRDSALIRSGEAERDVEGWRTRFGIAQSERALERDTDRALIDALRQENKELQEVGRTTITVVDTAWVEQPVARSDSTLTFDGTSGSLAFQAWVDVVNERMRLDWNLTLTVDVIVTESKDGRRDIFLQSPDSSNVTFRVDRFDYRSPSDSFWSRVSLGLYADAFSADREIGIDGGAMVCVEPWCVSYAPFTNTIRVSWQWKPFN